MNQQAPPMSQKFEFWDQRYSTQSYLYGLEPNDFLRAQAGRIKQNGCVLCLAEGEGRNAAFLAGLGHHVTAVDGSKVGLRKLELLTQERGLTVQTVCADLADFEIGSEQWDAIVSIWCHLPHALRAEVHRKCVAALKPGGCLILEAYTPKQLEYRTGGPQTGELMMTLAELREELSGLTLELAHEIERIVEEGTGHSGRSAVVQLVAYKP